MAIPERASVGELRNIEETAMSIDCFAENVAQDVYVYFVPDSSTIQDSPWSYLASHPLLYPDYASRFLDMQHSKWIDSSVSLDAFCDGWYRTDHHWNVKGSYAAYERILNALGGGRPLVPDDLVIFERPWFYGSLARVGLCDEWHDEIEDYLFDYSGYGIWVNGEAEEYNYLCSFDDYSQGSWIRSPFANRYAEYFHDDVGLIELRNQNANSGNELVVVGDSYTNCIERLLAYNYSAVYVIDPRTFKSTVKEFLEEHDSVGQVLILAGHSVLIDRVPGILQ